MISRASLRAGALLLIQSLQRPWCGIFVSHVERGLTEAELEALGVLEFGPAWRKCSRCGNVWFAPFGVMGVEMTQAGVPGPVVIWNPLDPRSVLRSGRVQGAFMVLLGLVGTAFGLQIPEEATGGLLDATNQTLTNVGVLVSTIGAIRAKFSARPF